MISPLDMQRALRHRRLPLLPAARDGLRPRRDLHRGRARHPHQRRPRQQPRQPREPHAQHDGPFRGRGRARARALRGRGARGHRARRGDCARSRPTHAGDAAAARARSDLRADRHDQPLSRAARTVEGSAPARARRARSHDPLHELRGPARGGSAALRLPAGDRSRDPGPPRHARRTRARAPAARRSLGRAARRRCHDEGRGPVPAHRARSRIGADAVWIDSHCHITAAAFDADRDAVLARARGRRRRCVAIGSGYGIAGNEAAVALAGAEPGRVRRPSAYTPTRRSSSTTRDAARSAAG